MNYIIYQTAFLGDIILATSMLNTIRVADPLAKVVFVTTPVGEQIFRDDGRIDKLVIYDKKGKDNGIRGLLRKTAEIKNFINGADSVFISPHRFVRASVAGFLTGSSLRAGFKSATFSFLYNRLVDYKFGIHEIERNFELLKNVFDTTTGELRPAMPSLEISGKHTGAADEKMKKVPGTGEKIAAIAPGSVWPTKRWPGENYAELIKSLLDINIKVILLGGKEDRKLCDSLVVRDVVNLAGQLAPLESAAAVGMSNVLVTNDSAPLHMASAMNVPAVALFGPTVLSFGFGPLAERSVVLENKSLECRPCGRHGGNACPQKHFRCMKDITPDMVLKEVIKIIN